MEPELGRGGRFADSWGSGEGGKLPPWSRQRSSTGVPISSADWECLLAARIYEIVYAKVEINQVKCDGSQVNCA